MNKREKGRLKESAYEAYRKGEPGLLEKAGIIPDRKYLPAKYKDKVKAARKKDEKLIQDAYDVYRQGKPGLLEKAGLIPDRGSLSATYNRRTKTGKLTVVRKGKRKKKA